MHHLERDNGVNIQDYWHTIRLRILWDHEPQVLGNLRVCYPYQTLVHLRVRSVEQNGYILVLLANKAFLRQLPLIRLLLVEKLVGCELCFAEVVKKPGED